MRENPFADVARLVGLALCLFALPAQATIIHYSTVLAGANETPPVASPGTGTATLIVDTDLNTLALSIDFADLIGTTMAAHLHCCVAPPGNVGVATAVPTFPGFPLGVTSGSYDETFDLTLASSFNPSFITANGGTVDGARTALLAGLDAGQSYLNIHTSLAPGGEIRGFVEADSAVPLPGSLTLLALGLTGLGLFRRRTA